MLTVVVGAMFGNEHLGIRDLIGAMVVLTGVRPSMMRTLRPTLKIPAMTEPHLAG